MEKCNNSNTATSEPRRATNGSVEAKPIRYVVVRDGYRVSEMEYEDPSEPACVDEVQFWTRVSENFSHGEKVESVEYDSKKHRVW